MEGNLSEGSPSSTSSRKMLITSLRILSPSFESNRHLSFDNLPLSTTIGDVKNLITPVAPNHPTPDQQRLIYRGRPLLDTSAALQNVLEPPLDAVHTLHLVLPPGPEISNYPYLPSDTGLRHRSTLNRAPVPRIPSYMSTATPDIPQQNRDPIATTANFQPAGQSSALPSFAGFNNIPPTPPMVSTGVGHPSHEETLRQTLEHHRRQAAELNVAVDRARTFFNAHSSRIMRTQGINIPQIDNSHQSSRLPSVSSLTGTNGSSIQTPHTHSHNSHQFPNNRGSECLLLARIRSLIMLLEVEVERNVAPSIDSMATVRSQLYAILDNCYRQLDSSSTSVEIEGLLLRLQRVYMRAYQIRQSENLRRQSSVNTTVIGNGSQFSQSSQSSEYYLITIPSGERMILTPPATSTSRQDIPETVPVFPDPPLARNEMEAMGIAPNNVLHNVVRQAILDQQPVRNNNNNNNNNNGGQFAQNLRRFWLFMRLYFFCYLFTDSNTWERFLFVGLAAVIAFFSQSDITNRLFDIIIQPIQRHLEGLIHGEAPGPAQQHDGNNNNNNQPNQQYPAQTGGAGQLRRIERAIALFIASLVPGLGERQVEVRNAAEEAARNARLQEQARIDEANANANLQEGQGHENAEVNSSEALPAGETSNNINVQQHQEQEQ